MRICFADCRGRFSTGEWCTPLDFAAGVSFPTFGAALVPFEWGAFRCLVGECFPLVLRRTDLAGFTDRCEPLVLCGELRCAARTNAFTNSSLRIECQPERPLRL